jgi:glutathione-specific gamma-glutamylcyclotransferase
MASAAATLPRVSPGARWIFGYGSLLWRPDFPYLERVPALLRGRARRFWQGSPDHRGRADAPGRVVTLVERSDALCWGAAYRVAGAVLRDVIAGLDDRESGGFERSEHEIEPAGGTRDHALVYVARAGNPNFLGPAPLSEMVEQMRAASGRSGSNADYVLRLAAALRELGQGDDHVFELAELIAASPARKAG